MKSLHVLGSRQYGGAEKFYVRLIHALNAAGHEAVAVHRPSSPVARALRESGARQYQLPLANKWDLWSLARLRQIVRREQPLAVQTYMGRATRLTRLPKDLRSVHVARLGGYYKLKGYYDHCDAWIGNTRGICDYLIAEGLPRQRVFMIGNFVPPPRIATPAEAGALRRGLGIPDGAWLLMSLGRFIEKKGFADLLHAVTRLPAEVEGRPLHLVLVGDGPIRGRLQELAAGLGLGDRVHWAGWQDDPDPYFGIADLLVCPSRHEPLGNVILEGWNHRLPVVSTASEGPVELITDGENALLAPPADPEGLADALRRVLTMSDDHRAALVAAGSRTLQREHGAAAVVERYVDLYRKLSNMPRRR